MMCGREARERLRDRGVEVQGNGGSNYARERLLMLVGGLFWL